MPHLVILIIFLEVNEIHDTDDNIHDILWSSCNEAHTDEVSV